MWLGCFYLCVSLSMYWMPTKDNKLEFHLNFIYLLPPSLSFFHIIQILINFMSRLFSIKQMV